MAGPDDGRRVLTNLKANYGQPGKSIDFVWENGRFRCTYEPAKANAGIGAQDKAERLFVALPRGPDLGTRASRRLSIRF